MGVEVCPLHKAEFKSSSIHVGAMSYPSQPKGQKRKYPDDEGEEEERPTGGGLSHVYPHKRMELLDITYDKIKKTQAEKNPTLERQVLLTNVVRSLRDSFEKDGIQVNGLTRDSPAPVWSNLNNQVSNLDPPPTNGEAPSFCGGNYPPTGDRPGTPAAVISPSMTTSDYYSSEHFRCVMMDFDDVPRAPTPFARGYERLEPPGALSWTDDNDRLTCLNWSSVLKSADMDIGSCCSGSEALDDSGSGTTSLHVLMPAVTGIEAYMNSSGVFSPSSSPNNTSSSLSGGSTSPASGSSPTSSEDEIFGDLDITLYDYDYTPLSPPNVAMAPLTAEELMWSLSNDQKPVSSDERDYMASVRT